MRTNGHRDTPVGRVPVRAGLGIYTLVLLVFVAGLGATLYFCRSMSGGMAMPGGWTMSMMWMRMPGQTWLESAAMFLLMWLAMMIAMMLPSALPTILRYQRARRSESDRAVTASTLLMLGGYFLVWGLVGAMFYPVGIVFAQATMRWTALSQAMPWIIGATVFIAGGLQFMPWTMFGLRRCRGLGCCEMSPSQGGPWSAWRRGVSYGVSCIACCSGPTLILLALGMMNPLVMAMVAVVIALEKMVPKPELVVRISGLGALLAGTIFLGRLVC